MPKQHDADFVAAMEDVLEVYQSPYDPDRPVVCIDEASKQLVADVTPPLPMEPGKPTRQDYEYERRGTVNLFMQYEPLTGKRRVKVTTQRTNVDFANLLRDLSDTTYAEAKKIVLVMDNLNTHRLAVLYQVFPPEEARRIYERFEVHHTPKHASWLNMAECELSALSRQCLCRRMESQEIVIDEVRAWEKERDASSVRINWRFTTNDARIRLRRLYPELVPAKQLTTIH